VHVLVFYRLLVPGGLDSQISMTFIT